MPSGCQATDPNAAAGVAQRAAMEAGELLALARHLRPRLVPGEEPPAAAVAERIVQMDAAELRELRQRLRESGMARRVPSLRAMGSPWPDGSVVIALAWMALLGGCAGQRAAARG